MTKRQSLMGASRGSRIVGVILTVLLCLLPLGAQAGFIYTYDNIDPIVSGLQRLALIFSDNQYTSIVVYFGLYGLTISATVFMHSAVTGRVGNPIAMFVPLIVGGVVFTATVIPKDDVYVIDWTQSRFARVTDVPAGLSTVLTWLSQIETTFINMIDMTAPPGSQRLWSYRANPSGSTIDILYNLIKVAPEHQDRYLTMTVDDYIRNCFMTEIGRPGSNISVDEIRSGNIAFQDYLGLANTEAKTTLVYTNSEAGKAGTPATCRAAWDDIEARISVGALFNNQWTNLMARACNAHGWPVGNDIEPGQTYTGPGELQVFANSSSYACRLTLDEAVYLFVGENGTPPWTSGTPAQDLAKHLYLASRIQEWVDRGDTTALGNYYQIQDTMGGLAQADQWLPYIRAAMYGVTLAILPFVVSLAFTGVALRALLYCLGTLVWLTVWSIMDAITFQFSMEYLYRAWLEVRDHDLGLQAIALAQTASVKTLAAFGKLKIMSVLLATSFMYVVFKFGGMAVAAMSERISGETGQYGAAAARQTMDPVGETQFREAMAQANAGQFAAATVGGWQRLSESYSHDRGTQAASSQKVIGAHGGVSSSIEATSSTNAGNTIGANQATDTVGGMAGRASGTAGSQSSMLLGGQGAGEAVRRPGLADGLREQGAFRTAQQSGSGALAASTGDAIGAGLSVGQAGAAMEMGGARALEVVAGIKGGEQGQALLDAATASRGANMSIAMSGAEMQQFFAANGRPEGMSGAQQAYAEQHGGVMTLSVSSSGGAENLVAMSYRADNSAAVNASGVMDASQRQDASNTIDTSTNRNSGFNARGGASFDGMLAANTASNQAAFNDWVSNRAPGAVSADGGVNREALQGLLENVVSMEAAQQGVEVNAGMREVGGGGASGGAKLGASGGKGVFGGGVNAGYSGEDNRTESVTSTGSGFLNFTKAEAERIAEAAETYGQGDRDRTIAAVTGEILQFSRDAERHVGAYADQVRQAAEQQGDIDVVDGGDAAWQKGRELMQNAGESFSSQVEAVGSMIERAGQADR